MKIDPEFSKYLRPLSPTEFQQLEANILAHGCRDAIKTWQGVIIDGHHRHQICEKHGLKFKTDEIQLPDRNAVKVWIIDNQDGQRNWTPFERVELALRKKDLLAREAKQRKVESGKQTGRGNKKVLENSPKPLETRKEIARSAKVSDNTVHRVEKILAKADKETKQQVRSGMVSINEAFKKVRAEEKQAAKHEIARELNSKPLPKPDGKFNVIVADPPWKYEKRVEDGTHRARLLYPEMDTAAICALPVLKLAEENCILWLWTTNAFMRDAFAVLDAWGFKDKTILTWAKDKMGCGDWLRGKTEHCIMAIRGKPVVTLTNQTTLLNGPLREHSRKPDEFFELVEQLCPGTRLEMFAREKRNGWQAWGAETEKF